MTSWSCANSAARMKFRIIGVRFSRELLPGFREKEFPDGFQIPSQALTSDGFYSAGCADSIHQTLRLLSSFIQIREMRVRCGNLQLPVWIIYTGIIAQFAWR